MLKAQTTGQPAQGSDSWRHTTENCRLAVRPELVEGCKEGPEPFVLRQTCPEPVKGPVSSEVEGLVNAAKKEALVIMTLYSPFMCAGQTVRHAPSSGHDGITAHIVENPAKAKKGIEIVTESLMLFVKACINLGVDGFYASTQGGESRRFEDPACFEECIKPYDLEIMEEIDRSCIFNILHVCDYFDGYTDLTPFLDYPGHVVNCSTELGSERVTGKEISRMFDRPYMGGIDRNGTIVSGSRDDIEKEVVGVLDDAPDRFILGADCTLPRDIDWDNIRTAISAAHAYKPNDQDEEGPE